MLFRAIQSGQGQGAERQVQPIDSPATVGRGVVELELGPDRLGAAARRPPAPVVYMLALLGAVAGVPAAVVENSGHSLPSVSVAILIAPIVEEICKLLGLILILEKRHHWIRGPAEIVVLAALSGAVFATIENGLYIFVLAPEAKEGFVAFRLMVCTSLHVATSTVFGIGLARLWRRMRAGRPFEIEPAMWFYVAAVALHAAYNTSVTILSFTGALEF